MWVTGALEPLTNTAVAGALVGYVQSREGGQQEAQGEAM